MLTKPEISANDMLPGSTIFTNEMLSWSTIFTDEMLPAFIQTGSRLLNSSAAGPGDHMTRAMVAFGMLKAKIGTTPVLKHFDANKVPVVNIYANKWAISASLVQDYDGVVV